MRMLVPPIVQRREIDRRLAAYFQNHRPSMFRQAISDFCRFYGVKRPNIKWFEYIDWGRTAGRTFEDGRIPFGTPGKLEALPRLQQRTDVGANRLP